MLWLAKRVSGSILVSALNRLYFEESSVSIMSAVLIGLSQMQMPVSENACNPNLGKFSQLRGKRHKRLTETPPHDPKKNTLERSCIAQRRTDQLKQFCGHGNFIIFSNQRCEMLLMGEEELRTVSRLHATAGTSLSTLLLFSIIEFTKLNLI